jgi:hypothetical protein
MFEVLFICPKVAAHCPGTARHRRADRRDHRRDQPALMGLPTLAVAISLCGVRNRRSVAPGHWRRRAPHKLRRHITHQMWRATFDGGNLHIRVCEG